VSNKSCHLLLLDEAISVLVEFIEKSLVSLHVWSRLALGSAEVSEEVSSLDFVQSTASVSVVLEPDLVDLVSNEILLIEVVSSIENRLWLWLNVSLVMSSRRIVDLR
jgi:hypothetical protein